MALAKSLAQRSTCEVEQVGAVITSVDFRKVLAIGYRGNASGLRNGCDQPVAGPQANALHAGEPARGLVASGSQPVASDRSGSSLHSCGCLHGEETAAIACDASRTEPKIVVSSKLPCRACAKRLINLGGVQDVYAPFDPGGGDVVDLLASVGVRTHVLE
jgi:deoxycytidylate deaminase